MQERMYSPPKLTAARKNQNKREEKKKKRKELLRQAAHCDHSTAHELAAQFAEKKSLIDFCRIFFRRLMAFSAAAAILSPSSPSSWAPKKWRRRSAASWYDWRNMQAPDWEPGRRAPSRVLPGACSHFSVLELAAPSYCEFWITATEMQYNPLRALRHWLDKYQSGL